MRRSHRDPFKFKLGTMFERQNINVISRLEGMQITIPIEYFLIIVTCNISLELEPSS